MEVSTYLCDVEEYTYFGGPCYRGRGCESGLCLCVLCALLYEELSSLSRCDPAVEDDDASRVCVCACYMRCYAKSCLPCLVTYMIWRTRMRVGSVFVRAICVVMRRAVLLVSGHPYTECAIIWVCNTGLPPLLGSTTRWRSACECSQHRRHESWCETHRPHSVL